MAVPKRKMSRHRTHSRRAQWKARASNLVTVRIRGREVTLPRRLVRAAERGLIDVD